MTTVFFADIIHPGPASQARDQCSHTGPCTKKGLVLQAHCTMGYFRGLQWDNGARTEV